MPESLGEQIFKKLESDPCFLGEQPKSTHVIWREFCETIEQVLGNQLLEAEVRVQSFLQARILILGHLMDNGWKERILRAHYVVELEMMDGVENVVAAYHQMNRRFLHGIMGILQDIPGFLERHDTTEYEFFTHAQVGRFNDQTIARWMADDLTIRDLLLLQPRVLFKNTD